MTPMARCRRCGRLFLPDHPMRRIGPWRLCLACRGPLPPTGGCEVSTDSFNWSHVEAAA